MSGCVFDRNEASDRGGAVNLSSFQDDIYISNCIFTENVAGFSGGAVYSSSSGFSGHRLIMRGCELRSNVAVGVFEGEGGGLYTKDTDVDLVDCVFVDNEAETSGGGAYLKVEAGSAVNCVFIGNQTLLANGGGVEITGGAPYAFVNCLFVGNFADGKGGGIADPSSGGGPDRQFLNCTFVANSAGGFGGGVWAVNNGDIMTNCILRANTDSGGGGQDGQIAFGPQPFSINYCCIDGWDGTLGGIGNHGNDPLFVDIDGDDDVLGTEDDNLRLTSGSPCVDAADNDAVPNDDADADDDGFTNELLPLDLDGNPRFSDDPETTDTGNGTRPIVDMGPYEFLAEVVEDVHYVGVAGGSWFDPDNWSDGDVPDENTDVVIATTVLVDQAGAVAKDITIEGTGGISILFGSLVARDILVLAGGFVELAEPESLLQVRGLNVSAGAGVLWLAGTIEVVGGAWNSPDSITIGCTGVATLILDEDARVNAPDILVCTDGSVLGNGTLAASIVSNEGMIGPGTSAGVLTIEGDYEQSSSGTLVIELGGYEPGQDFDTLTVEGIVLDLRGTLQVILLNGFAHEIGGSQLLVEADAINGTFDTQDIPALPASAEFIFQQDQETISLYTMLTATGSRLHVNASASGGGDGQAWESSIKSLQGALEVAEFFPGQIAEIWVATGTYVPTRRLEENDPRSETFQMIEGVSLFGGFAGDEASIDERDIQANPTSLSGDLKGDDGPDFARFDENALIVVYAHFGNPYKTETWLDGFTVTSSNGVAGGFFSTATPHIIDCIFTTNYQGNGATVRASLILENCQFFDNTSRGLRVEDTFTSPLISDCWFEGNGGGLWFQAQDGLVTDCVFINNDTGTNGGGCRFETTNASLVKCIIVGNSSDDAGGGVWFSSSTGMISNCFIAGNVSNDEGGGVTLANAGDAGIANCVISGNACLTDDAGGISVEKNGLSRVVNCVIFGNESLGSVSGVFARFDDVVVDIDNCVIWGNTAGAGPGEATELGGAGIFDINYTIVEDWTGDFGGVGNSGSDPLFVDPDGSDDIPGTDDDDLRLQPGSPAIDAGNNDALPADTADLDGDGFTLEELPIDLDGAQRQHDDPDTRDTGNGEAPIVDIGPYEFGAPIDDLGEYIGPDGGSWFVPGHWSGGVLPGKNTDVTIANHVVIDAPGAVARNVNVLDGGTLEITTGSLMAESLSVAAGGKLRLAHPTASLETNSMTLLDGALLEWLAGTIRLIGGTWMSAADIFVGCGGQAHLILAQDAIVSAPMVQVCPNGAIEGTGTLESFVVNDGQFAPGFSAGALIVDGDYVQTDMGEMLIELASYEPGIGHDVITVTGTAMLDGMLTVSVLPEFEPLLLLIDFLSASLIEGAFQSTTFEDPGDGFALALRQSEIALTLITVSPGPTIFVDATAVGPGNGVSWETATADLEVAIGSAELSGGQVSSIWVADGEYKPSRETDANDPRSVTFQLVEGLAIYGGFAGGEETLEKRDFEANVAVLSGDIAGDDDDEFSNVSDNAFQVITANGTDSTAILDGFTITRGYFGENVDGRGAGVLCESGSPTINNCVIEMNRAHTGSGMYIDGGSPALTNCHFLNNTNADPGVSSGDGGGLVIRDGTVSLVACEFMGNGTSGNGGAIYMRGDVLLILENCGFTENEAVESGGGLYAENGVVEANGCVFSGNRGREVDQPPNFGGGASFVFGSATLTDCTFNGNLADDGAGLAASITGIQVTLEGCVFDGNVATKDGGGLLIDSSSPTLVNCEFINNVSADHGGGVYAVDQFGSQMKPVFQSCLFQGNSAILGGGISAVVGNALPLLGPTFIDCQFVGNLADEEGGGLRSAGADTELSACTFEGNTAPLGSGVYSVSGGGILRGSPVFVGANKLTSTEALAPGLPDVGMEIGAFEMAGGFQLVDRGSEFEDHPIVHIDIAGVMPGLDFDLLDADVAVAELTGALFVDFINGFEPAESDVFDIIAAGSRVGQFGVSFFGQLPDGLIMSLVNHDTGVTLTVEPFEGDVIFAGGDDQPLPGLPRDAILDDLDADGDPDIALVIRNDIDGNQLVVLLNAGLDGKGDWLGFTQDVSTVPVGSRPGALATGFFDADSHLDIAVVDEIDSTVSIFLNDGGAGYTLHQNYPVGQASRAVAVGNLNADAMADLVVANSADNTLSILIGAGDGSFVLQDPVAAGSNPTRVEVDDVDGDLDDDLLVLNSDMKFAATSTVSVHLNDGDAIFAPPLFFDAGEDSTDLSIADLNNDGFNDAVATNETDATMTVFVNLGGEANVFASGVEVPVGDAPGSLVAADLDFDDDLDLAILVEDEIGIPIVRFARNDLNDGETIIFSEFNDIATGQDTLLVLAGDVNLDSNVDLVAVNAGFAGAGANGGMQGSVSVLLNETGPAPIGDLDGDGIVGTTDLLILLGMWGPCGDCNDCNADLDGDCVVGSTDLIMLLGNWS